MRAQARLFAVAGTTLVALGAAACGESAPPADVGSDPNQVFTSTSVQLDPDGTSVVKRTTITLAQELAENAAREASRKSSTSTDGVGSVLEAIYVDSGCAGASLWIYDQPNELGNRLCLNGVGTASLSKYCRVSEAVWVGSHYVYICVSSWSLSIRSFWPGVESGYLRAIPLDAGGVANQYFSAGDGRINADSFGRQAVDVVLGQ
jgi:hypothetical protein